MKLRQFSTSHVHVHNLHILNVYLNQTFLTLSLLKVPRHSNVTPGDHYMKLRNLTNYLLMLLSNIKPIFFNQRHPEIREQMSLCLVCICDGDLHHWSFPFSICLCCYVGDTTSRKALHAEMYYINHNSLRSYLFIAYM